MNKIEFFEDENGKSDVLDFLEEIRLKSKNNKNYRIQYRQIMFYINLLKENGSTLNSNIMKNIDEDIWELRPGYNRVFYFYYDKSETYVLLHHFRKKSQKTPKREIVKAKNERNSYLLRKECSKWKP